MEVYINGNLYEDANFDGNGYANESTGFKPSLTDFVAHCEGIYKGSSTTSLTVSDGTKSLTIDRNRPIFVGSWVRIEAQSSTAIYMEGTVTAYTASTGALTVSVAVGDTGGAGTLAAWNIYTLGKRGRDGNSGTLATTSQAGVVTLATQVELDARAVGKVPTVALFAEGLGAKGTDIASASSLTLPASGDYFHVTGTTGVTAISTRVAGRVVALRFAGAVTITHHATSLILPGGVNITTKADDVLTFVSEGSGNWRCITGAQAASQTEADARISTAKPLTPAVIATGVGAKGTDIASAGSLTLPALGTYFHVTGTTTIGSLSTRAAGRVVHLRFAGALTLTNSVSLILGGADITTSADAVATFVSEGSGVWRLASYKLGSPVNVPGLVLLSRQVISSPVAQVDITSVFGSSYCDHYRVIFSVVKSSTSRLCMRWGSGSIATSGYYWTYHGDASGNGGPDLDAFLTDNVAVNSLQGEIFIENPSISISRTLRFDVSAQITSSSAARRYMGAAANANTFMDRFRLYPDGGNFNSGIVSVYGVRNS